MSVDKRENSLAIFEDNLKWLELLLSVSALKARSNLSLIWWRKWQIRISLPLIFRSFNESDQSTKNSKNPKKHIVWGFTIFDSTENLRFLITDRVRLECWSEWKTKKTCSSGEYITKTVEREPSTVSGALISSKKNLSVFGRYTYIGAKAAYSLQNERAIWSSNKIIVQY